MAQTKTYALLDDMNPTVPIFVQASPTEMIRLNKRREWAAFLQVSFVDKNGEGKNARFKLGAKSIWLEDQIKDNIPANAKFSNKERDMVKFRYGFLVTNVGILQEYLESIPHFEGFDGEQDNSIKKAYRIYDPNAEARGINSKNKRIQVALSKIFSLSEDDLDSEIMRLYGVFVQMPKLIEDKQNLLADMLSTDEGINAVIDERVEEDKIQDNMRVWIGKLVRMGILKFDEQQNQVHVKRAKGWVKVREIPSTFADEERVSMFAEFLHTADGKPLAEDLLKLEESYNKKLEASRQQQQEV